MLDAAQIKLLQWINTRSDRLNVNGCSVSLFGQLMAKLIEDQRAKDQRFLFLFSSEQILEEFSLTFISSLASSKGFIGSDNEDLFFSDINQDIYENVLPNETEFLKRTIIIQNVLRNQNKFFGMTIREAAKRIPKKAWYQNSNIKICVGDILSPNDLVSKLLSIGFRETFTLEEPGVFTRRGETIDVFPFSGNAFRIHYFEDLIENIFLFDDENKLVNKSNPIDNIELTAGPQSVLTGEEFRLNFRKNVPLPTTGHKLKHDSRNLALSEISKGRMFDKFSFAFPLFFETENTNSIFEFFVESGFLPVIIDERSCIDALEKFKENLFADYNRILQENTSSIFFPNPNLFFNFDFINKLENIIYFSNLKIGIDSPIESNIELDFKPVKLLWNSPSYLNDDLNLPILERKILKIDELLKSNWKIYFFYCAESMKDEFLHLLKDKVALIHKIEFKTIPLGESYFSESEKSLILSENDFFGDRKIKKRAKTRSNKDMFAEIMSSLEAGDFVIHSQFGVGKYLGIENITSGGTTSEYLIIEYSDRDKVYVPVFKVDLVQKYSTASSPKKLDSLRNTKFLVVKNRIKESVRKLAFSIVELEAKRKLAKGFSFSPPDHLFRDFELSFPYTETADQVLAINTVIDKMQQEAPMDVLICGDVGFGKTEVAMRAAFKAVLDKKQVAILSPTTILTLQHFHSFKKRFKDFPVVIEFVSRFKSAKETKEIFIKLESGEIDILIGTHKILSDHLKFKDLGLLIIDEEHRFGVGHKEKLKLLKENIDILSMSATPIPRTLQLSFLGLRDICLIRTPPPNRQSIKNYIIEDDLHIIKIAIENEVSRGGQVFIVHNKVNDIELYVSKIRELLPNISLAFAHGQMRESELEKIINDFYEGKYKILVSTTIIESGIDVPNANTLIVDRADTFGLSQLHQLRGRIGRSDRKAYAYFSIPKKELSTEAEKRIKALQQYSEIGSGFNLASADLEIRGAGDILGPEQSGHIESVGLEIYLELLQECINDIKGIESHFKDIDIKVHFPTFIPSSFIYDSKERLKLYKKLSRITIENELDSEHKSLIDFYETIPLEVENLFSVLKAKIILSRVGVSSINVNPGQITIKFTDSIFQKFPKSRDNLLELVMKSPKVYKINQDYRFEYFPKNMIKADEMVQFANLVAGKIMLC